MPIKSINLKDGMRFIIAGVFSVFIFKYFDAMGFNSTKLFVYLTGSAEGSLSFQHYFYFISVGLIEELSKMSAFFIFFLLMTKVIHEKLHPISVMFYCGMVGLGFGVAENVHYATSSYQSFTMLGWIGVTPLLCHMICGFFMGYWISLGQMGTRMYNRSYFDIIINKRENT